MRPLILTLALLVCSPAHAELRLHASVQNAGAIQWRYDLLPERVRRVPVEVRVEKVKGHPTSFYDWERRVIYLRPEKGEQGLSWQFLHEVGHHAHVMALTPEEWTRWVVLWRQRKGKMPTAYARTNPREGFAECFREWIRKKPLNKALQAFFDEVYG